MDKNNDKDPVGKPNPLIERQIEEILRSTERTYRRKMFWNRAAGSMRFFFRRLGQGSGQRSPYGRLMLWGLLLVLAGMVVSATHIIPALASMLVLAGIVVFISPIFLSFRRNGGSSGSSISGGKYWRGRPLDGDERWHNTKEQFGGVMRWLRGGDDQQPPRGGARR